MATTPPSTKLPLGLSPVPISILPIHSSLPDSRSALSLSDFILFALNDAAARLAVFTKQDFKHKKTSPPSTAEVSIGTFDGWAVRKSVHIDHATKGTASWDEFRDNVAIEHSENEATYTPSIKWCNKVLEWDVSAEIESLQEWSIKEFAIYEVCHHLPFPLKDRIFPFVIISALRKAEKSLTVVSMPLADSHSLPGSELRFGDIATGKYVLGKYAAIERVTQLPDLVGPDHQIEWLMGTLSDAGGNLPRWLQEKSVPGEIAKDVGLFLGWVDKNRTV